MIFASTHNNQALQLARKVFSAGGGRKLLTNPPPGVAPSKLEPLYR